MAAVVVVVGLMVFGGGPSYLVKARFQDAGQTVNGNLVKVAGANVGTIKQIDVGNDGAAVITLSIKKKAFLPLHQGTKAILRNSSLSSVAGRYITLEPGPNNAPKINSGGDIPAENTRSATDFDEVLNTLDAEGRMYLQQTLSGGASALEGAEPATRRLLEDLNPALAQTRALADEIDSDEPALQQLITKTAAVSSALAGNRDDLGEGLVSTATTLHAIADERDVIRKTVERGPAFFRRANTTLANARPLLAEARPLLRQTRQVSPRLADTLRIVQPLVAQARPFLKTVRVALPDLSDTLDRLPVFAQQAVPALDSTTGTLEGAKGILSELRPYTPDLVSGLLESFNGKTAGNYDANGHFGRVPPVFTGKDFGVLEPLLGGLTGLAGPLLGGSINDQQTGLTNRCPGGATQPAADGSNPLAGGLEGTCDPGQVPRGGDHAPPAKRAGK